MNEKRPIDRKREAGGAADIGTKEDGAILEMTKIGNRQITIKERAIYEFMLADQIDPKRTNIDLPKFVHKLIINKGAESEMVSRVFLTAKTLFQSEFFEDGTDLEKANTLSLDILQEMSKLEEEINDFIETEKSLIEKYNSNKEKMISYSIPSMGNVETRCKTIFQKADHIEQMLMEIIMVFYSQEGLKKQSHFPDFYNVIKEKYGDEDPFSKFLNSAQGFMKLVRALRNALDHRLDFVKTYDFELQPNSNVLTPCIELKKYQKSKLEKQALSDFLKAILPNLILIFENTIVYMSNKTFVSKYFAQGVREIPEKERRYKNVRFSFWSNIGNGGYYNQ